MHQSRSFDAVVVGAGPNGLAAAITLAREGRSVIVFEANEFPGGGARSEELTLPGFTHDICSAVYPMAIASPFFQGVPLADHGLAFIHPPVPLAHPFDDGSTAMLERSIPATAATLGVDSAAYRKLFEPLVNAWKDLAGELLRPIRFPRHPVALARFGLLGLRSAQGLANRKFKGGRARALFAGLSAHSMLPLDWTATAAFGLVLGTTGHAAGWPLARGGAQKITDALVSYLRSLGGEIITGTPVKSVDELPRARAVLCDVTPRQLLQIGGSRLPARFRRKLQRYRYGVGAFKIDWALDGPTPWRDAECLRAGTLHLGGQIEEIIESEEAGWRGRHAERPFVLFAQQSLFDPHRAPPGKHTAWAYCHVPNGSTFDMTARIEEQVERFAPGFRDRILARHIMFPADLEAKNANLVGGDINGGAQDIRQLFSRPTLRFYSTPARGLYICSSSTPPGGGVHGMCGYLAAQQALRASLRR